MSRRQSKYLERQLIDAVNAPENGNKCGECRADIPTWASWNLGILLCGRCANLHKKVLHEPAPGGGLVSEVKSLTLERWTEDQVEKLRRIGNKRASRVWNAQGVPFPQFDLDAAMERFLRDKYLAGLFRDDGFAERSGQLTPQSARSRLGSLARPRRNTLPRLSHRKATQYEQGQYAHLVRKLVSHGFSRDAALEALSLSSGDADYALDILENDAKSNPQLAELPPALPRRPSQAQSAPATATATGATAATGAASPEWWTGQTQQQPQTAQVPQPTLGPQIYQYTDPTTGQVSYVDANGQQYLDPSNPQHQQMLMQQTNPQQLAQQMTRQNILSLYSQPDSFTTNVAAPGQPTQTQQPQQSQTFQPQQTQTFQPQQTQTFQQQYAQPGFAGQPVVMQPTVQQTAYYQPQYHQQQWGGR